MDRLFQFAAGRFGFLLRLANRGLEVKASGGLGLALRRFVVRTLHHLSQFALCALGRLGQLPADGVGFVLRTLRRLPQLAPRGLRVSLGTAGHLLEFALHRLVLLSNRGIR